MYPNEWHVEHHDKTSYSAKRILSPLFTIMPVTSVLDVGCGRGDWLSAAIALGTAEIMGCDGPWARLDDLLIPPDRFKTIDLRQELDLGRRFDLAICLEVAEHVPEPYAANIVKSLISHSDMVFFGAAIPYQGGYRHVNEQWPSWWSKIFARHGYRHFDPVRRSIWDDPNVHFWYKQNALLYIHQDREDLTAQAIALQEENGMPVDVVHPERYTCAASYQAIAFKPLIRALPGAVTSKLRSMLK